MSIASTAESRPAAPTLVLGIGNPILGDDGAGWRVVEVLARAGPAADGVMFDCVAVGGLALMEQLVGVRRAILVDAVLTRRDPAGTVRVMDLAGLPAREASHLDAAHDVTLATALAAGRAMGVPLPSEVAIVTIEAAAVGEFTERLTPDVEAAIPVAVKRVRALMAGG